MIKTKDFPLFSPKCFFTDDTVMTLAIAEGLMNGGGAEDFIAPMKKCGRLYSDSGYKIYYYLFWFDKNI